MNRLSGQFTPPEPTHRGDGNAASSSAVHSLAAGHAEQALFRIDLGRSLQLHRRLALAVAMTGMALAVVYFLRLWPVYIGQSLVYVQPASPRVLDQGGPVRWPYDGSTYESYIQQQIASVTRPDVLVNALHKLDPGSWQGSSESDQAAAERLGRAVEITRNGSYQFAIGVHASNAEVAAQLANAVTNSYIESASRDQKAGDKQRLAILREERDRVQSELAADRAEQDALNKQLGVAAVGVATPDFIDEDIGRTRAELVKARTEHDQAAARFTAMGAGQISSSGAIEAESDDQAAGDPGLISMKTSLNQRRAALLTQMANLTPNHPEYKQDEVELAKINGTLDSMTKDLRAKASARTQARLRTDLERTAGVEAKLNGQLRQLVGAAGGATPKLQRASDLTADITRLQSRFTNVDEQLHNLMLEDGAPGAVFLSAAAVPPLRPAKSGVVRNTFVLGFASIFFGMFAAVAAHKMDPRVYIASDVEQVLGFAPMAQLPDFTEVSDAVAEEHMLRLSAALEHARKQNKLKSCIFTGTGPGTGVTTVATRVREMLEGMGRPAVLVEASGAPYSAASGGGNGFRQTGTRGSSRSAAFLQRVVNESEKQHESFILTDTAPLVVSAETEYLARFADCAIVVIESGVTTRAQLRETACTLRQLDVSSVGFVLNRVGQAKADPAFRHSVRAAEQHLRIQGRSAAKRSLNNSQVALESSSTGERLPLETARMEPERAVQFAEEISPRQSGAAVSERPRGAPVQASLPEPVAELETEIPWWLADFQAQPEGSFSAVLAEPAKAHESDVSAARPLPISQEYRQQPAPAQSWETASSGQGDFMPRGSFEEARQPDLDESQFAEASRLSGLRSVLFSLGLKNLNKTRESASLDDEPLPAFLNEQERQIHGHAFGPFPEPFSSSVAPTKDNAAAIHVTAIPEFLPPREFIPAGGKDQAQSADGATHRDRRDAYDEVEILPSWRGQYKTKK